MSPSVSDRRCVDTVIVGSGPSALILSFILHGNIPYYDLDNPHPDPILHKKLSQSPCLLKLNVDELTAHFDASRISYSTQALPVNVLLDTLLRPLSDVEPGEHPPALVWRKEPERAVKHVVIGDTSQAGGQWASNPVDASWDIGTLSYLEQLSLPQYSLFDHLGLSPESLSAGCERPTRRQIADYLAAYPAAVGIEDAIEVGAVSEISRTTDEFFIGSHGIASRHLVLASGIFTQLIPPPPLLQPLGQLGFEDHAEPGSLLVIGSGFSAADVILSNIEKRQIIHVFRWQPQERPSPLQACHPQAYPDYAGVYQQMKRATERQANDESLFSPTPRKQKKFLDEWVWSQNYTGLANAEIMSVETDSGDVLVSFKLASGEHTTHVASSLAYVVGRRGSLGYLSPPLQHEVISNPATAEKAETNGNMNLISGRTLREKVEIDAQVAPNVFAIGSLTGDSLIRFAFGGCVESAGHILADPGTPRPEKVKMEKELETAADGSKSPIRPLTGGHEDLGRAPDARNLVQSRFKWARGKSFCAVS